MASQVKKEGNYVIVITKAKKPRSAAWAGGVCAAMGMAVMLGWIFHIQTLVQVRPSLAPMQFNTALCVMLAGAGLWMFQRDWTRWTLALALGWAVTVLTGLTLCECLTGMDLRIDQLFFHAYIFTQTSQPGRMSPASASCLFLIGLTLLLTGSGMPARWRQMLTGSAGSVVMTVCGVALLGYAVELPGTYGWGEFSRMAPHTAACVMVLGAGVFAMAWYDGRRRGAPAPPWLPVPVGMGVLAGAVIFYQALETRQDQEITQAVKTGGDGLVTSMNLKLESRMKSLRRMAQRWEFAGRPSQAAWEDDAKNYVSDFPDFQAIEWIDAEHLVQWIEPRAGNEAKIGQDMWKEERRRVAQETAMVTRQPTMTQAVELFRGGQGFIMYIPIFTKEHFDGWIAGVFKAQPMFDRYFPDTVVPGYSIHISDGGEMYQRGSTTKPARPEWVYTSRLDLRGVTWTVGMWPSPALLGKMDSALPELVLLAGIPLAVLMGLAVYLAQRASAHARKLSSLNEELHHALDEVKTLSGLLPICAGCKRIRDDGGYWNAIERYVSARSEASFSHGICPECALKFYEAEGMEPPEDVVKAASKPHGD
ncbi:MAG TPA: CHASE domain-containing protein [Chthoniobacteraceae bacterium]|nr:CHASE domain-containing protein [Chthoniobacteraceae bacterium]